MGRRKMTTAAIKAVKEGDLMSLLKAINEGEDLNAADRNHDNYTALMFAVMYRRFESVTALLESGCDLETKNIHGQTALHIGVVWKSTTCAKLLIDAKCNIDVQDEFQCSALMYATMNENITLMEHLIEGGCNLELTNRFNKTVVDLARRPGTIKILLDNGCELRQPELPREIKKLLQGHEQKREAIYEAFDALSFEFPSVTVDEICDFLLPRYKR